MYPILFATTEYLHYPAVPGIAVPGLSVPPDTTTNLYPFTTQGIGALSDCISCVVTEERNGMYELEMKYPVSGVHFEDIEMRSLVLAKPNYYDDPQPFRVYKITKPLNGVCTIYAQHISYDLSGLEIPGDLTAESASDAAALLNSYARWFTISTQLSGGSTFETDVPASVRSWFGGKEGSMIDLYGGEWKYDIYSCQLMAARGEDRGVTVRYGKNLITLEQEEACENLYSAVRAYYRPTTEDDLITSSLVSTGLSLSMPKILFLDCSDDFDEEPTVAQLTAKASEYITNNNLSTPHVNLDLDFVQLANLDRVDLCDTVTVEFEQLGVNATAKCIKTVWDTLKERYTSITLGDAKSSFSDTIANVSSQAVTETVRKKTNDLIEAIDHATQRITGNLGGYVVIYDSDDDGEPDEILVMNQPTIEDATKVWRWNKSGLGYSSTGYEGTYGLAMTADGAIVADFITTGTMSANRIKGGTLALGGNSNGNGLLEVYNASNSLVARMNNAGLYAIAGTIGGFTITSTALYTDSLTSTSSGAIGLSTADFTRTIGGTSRSGLRLAIGSNFAVSNAGALYASSGVIGGYTIGTYTLKGGTVGMCSTSGQEYAFWAGASTGASSPFRVGHSGELYASYGTIGGWGLSDSYIYASGSNFLVQLHVPTVQGDPGNGNADVLVCRSGSSSYTYPLVLSSSGRMSLTGSSSSDWRIQASYGNLHNYIAAYGMGVYYDSNIKISLGLASDGYSGALALMNSSDSITIALSGQSGHIQCVSLTQTSDRRLKQNITPLTSEAEEFIYSLKPVSYRFKAQPEVVRHGFVAQDVEDTIYDRKWGIVTELREDDMPEGVESDGYKSLAYTELIADLVATVQSLNERIKVLEAQ